MKGWIYKLIVMIFDTRLNGSRQSLPEVYGRQFLNLRFVLETIAQQFLSYVRNAAEPMKPMMQESAEVRLLFSSARVAERLNIVPPQPIPRTIELSTASTLTSCKASG